MSNEKIKEHYITKKVYETKELIEYKSQPIYLDSSFLSAIYTDLVDSEWKKMGSSLPDSLSEIYSRYCEIFFTITYQQKKEDEFLSLNFHLRTGNDVEKYPYYLRKAKISFLMDDTEKYHPNNVLDYESHQMFPSEKLNLKLDKKSLIKIVKSNKIEYKIRFSLLKERVLSGGELSQSDLFKIRGFYNELFDNQFMKEELLKQIDVDIEERERKEKEEREKEERKKRANKKSSSDCFVITATMGDPSHPVVEEFRKYRDSKLLTNEFGRAFIKFYYRVGPYASIIIRKSLFLRKISFWIFVNPIYKRLKR